MKVGEVRGKEGNMITRAEKSVCKEKPVSKNVMQIIIKMDFEQAL